MGFLDNLRNAAQNAGLGGVASGLSELETAGNLVKPQALTNLELANQQMGERITALETALPSDPSQVGELSGLRTLMMDQYRHIREGGTPAPDAVTAVRIKAMPQYQQVVADFGPLQARLAALEVQYLHATFGYQQPDGQILVPDLAWSDKQWQDIVAQSLQQTPRSWLQSDPTQYVA